jgi:leucyl/phenylalanyl-tRNA--protein transferase
MTHPKQQVPFWLNSSPVLFPPSKLAMKEPDGLLAVGGDLSVEWLLAAYSKGIFPWFNPGEPILWWTPNPRSVLFIDQLKIKRSLRKTIKKLLKSGELSITLDTDFEKVMRACAEVPRNGQDGTWISEEMLTAYLALHSAGHAHSVEVRFQGELVGGLYGVAIGKMFFGESMFSKKSDTSKIALVALALQLNEWGFSIIDTQVETAHLNSLGAENIPREIFESIVSNLTQQSFTPKKWELNPEWPNWIDTHLQQSSTLHS